MKTLIFTEVHQWWANNSSNFPWTAEIASAVLAIEATSVPSERVLSRLRLVI